MGARELYVILVLIFVLSCCLHLAAGTKTQNLGAYVGEVAELACRVDKQQCGSLHSVKWYKDTQRIFVLSHAGSIRRPEGDDAKERMQVEYSSDKSDAKLLISNVELHDEAIYKCEITYLEVRESCDVVQIVNLTTLAKPENIRILGPDGTPVPNGAILGPKIEGDEIDLICQAEEGKPIPRISWYNDSTMISRAHYTTVETSKGKGSARSTLKLTLQRGDLNAKFECRVESQALKQPVVIWVGVDIHVPPTRITWGGNKSHVVAGNKVALDCNVHGARPAATVKWINGTQEITNPNLVESIPYDNRDGTYTTKSTLTFQASHYENGMKIHCYAGNEVTKKKALPEIHSLLILEVRYPPVITVKPKNITVIEATKLKPHNEGLYLSCSYKANPQELKGAWWTKDGKNLTDTTKYRGGNLENPPLFIFNATREDMGEYLCWLSNEVGTAKSEDNIYLDVLYPPDVEVIMEPSSPVKELDNATVEVTCNVTDGNPFNFTRVRWYWNNRIIKEFPECNYTSDLAKGGDLCDKDTVYLSLRLENVNRDFAGKYACQGENEAGWGPISEPQEIIVFYPPSPAKLTSQPSDRVVKGGSLKLTCSVDDVGNPKNVTYKWFRGSHQLTEITTNEYNITHVGLETRSNFICIAVNEGGESQPANRSINVTAPPQIFNKLQPYKGVLYDSEQVNITCRFECSPECSIVWKKNDKVLDFRDYLYNTTVTLHPPDRQKNMFESVESTLVWNMTTWGNKINKTTPNANYTCQSRTIDNGLGPSSTIEIAIDYPPDDVKVTPSPVNVIEGMYHPPIKCSGKGQPQALDFKWRKTPTSEPFATGDTLNLGLMDRNKSSSYICEASNKHGSQQAILYIFVQYAPECTLTRGKNKEGEPSLICTVTANPQQVDFQWSAKEGNDTFVINSKDRIQKNGLLESILTLDPSIDTRRTYFCRANNTVGHGNKTCEIVVDGILPWWKSLNHENLIIIIASIVAIIICVIIICIVIIVLCRRKRANTKSPLNQSSGADKIRPPGAGFAAAAGQPVGNMQDHRHQPMMMTNIPLDLSQNYPLMNANDPNDRGFYENLPYHGLQNAPNKPYRPSPYNDLVYADVDYMSNYGPINYKAASIYASMKRNKNNNKMEEIDKNDLL